MPTGQPMPAFERGAVVRVPFPYTNRPIRQRRPALVVSASGLAEHLLWVVMITSAGNRRWESDIALTEDYADMGLPAPSLIRPAKIATIDADSAETLGHVPPAVLARVERALRLHLGM